MFGAIAKRLCTGLQIHVARFDSGSRLQYFDRSPPTIKIIKCPGGEKIGKHTSELQSRPHLVSILLPYTTLFRSPCQGRGREFESRFPLQFETLICNVRRDSKAVMHWIANPRSPVRLRVAPPIF